MRGNPFVLESNITKPTTGAGLVDGRKVQFIRNLLIGLHLTNEM